MRTLPPPSIAPQVFASFWERVEKTESCWLYRSQGRGYIRIDGHDYTATSISWMIHTGYYPKLLLCHTCDNPRCVNPDHLFEGTHKDNSQDMLAKGRGGQQRQRERFPYRRRHPEDEAA